MADRKPAQRPPDAQGEQGEQGEQDLFGMNCPPGVTWATSVAHQTGDKPVDSVDNPAHKLTPSSVDRPNVVADFPRPGVTPAESPNREADRSNHAEPIETGVADPQPGPEPDAQTGHQTGRDLAHAALRAARERAAARGAEPGVRRAGRPGTKGSANQGKRRRWSGAGSDERDPQPLGRLAARLSAQLGWNERLAGGQVFGQWSRLVGEEVAEHARPVALKDGELTVQASSTAWATQLRLLQRQLVAKIAARVGDGVVTRMRIQGPTAPSWRKGPRHVSGRGPRDTYG